MHQNGRVAVGAPALVARRPEQPGVGEGPRGPGDCWRGLLALTMTRTRRYVHGIFAGRRRYAQTWSSQAVAWLTSVPLLLAAGCAGHPDLLGHGARWGVDTVNFATKSP